MSLGIYPDIGLAKARELHQEARQKLADGLDPSALKQAAKARIANTFGELAADWLARQAVKDIRRAKLALWLERECASLADMPIDSVTARDILAVARAVEDSSADRARRIVGLCGQVMRFGVASGIAERDPSGDLKGALSKPPNGNFTATTDPANLATLMRAI